MQQGNVIFGVILLAYIVFITQRGELSTYLTLLRGGGQQPASGTSGTSSNPVTAGADTLLSQAQSDLGLGGASVPSSYNLSPSSGKNESILDYFPQ